jgi:transposase, IS6 family
MAVFRWRHFAGEIILWAVRWYCRYGISYRELEEMMGERGVAVDHTTVYRRSIRQTPPCMRCAQSSPWRRTARTWPWRMRAGRWT